MRNGNENHTANPSDPGGVLATPWLLVHMALCPLGLEVLIPEGGRASARRPNNDSIELEVSPAPGHLGSSQL